jgi:hypothetical protein
MVPAVLAVFIPAPAPAQTASEGPFRLIGIIAGSGFTGAVLDDSTGNQTFYHLRESLPDGSQIVAAADDHISVKRSDGTSYRLFIIHDAKPSPQTARPPVAATPAVIPPPVPATAPVETPVRRVSRQDQNRSTQGHLGAAVGRQSGAQGAGGGTARPADRLKWHGPTGSNND